MYRPKDLKEQQEYYSGKKKCATLKNLLVIDETCQMCFLSATYEGKANDKSLADLKGYQLAPQRLSLSRYRLLGMRRGRCPNYRIIEPKKKPRGGELTPPEQATHRQTSSILMRIEHAIGGVKRYSIVKDQIRLLKDRIRLLPWKRVGACIPFAYSADRSVMPHNKY